MSSLSIIMRQISRARTAYRIQPLAAVSQSSNCWFHQSTTAHKRLNIWVFLSATNSGFSSIPTEGFLQLHSSLTKSMTRWIPWGLIHAHAARELHTTSSTGGWKSIARNRRPHGMLVVRRKKMNKHKLKKTRKRNFFLFRAIKEKRDRRREAKLRAEIEGIVAKGYAFSAEEYVDTVLRAWQAEQERATRPPPERELVVPDNVVYPWPNPYNRHDPANKEALEKKLHRVLQQKKDPKKLNLYKWRVKVQL